MISANAKKTLVLWATAEPGGGVAASGGLLTVLLAKGTLQFEGTTPLTAVLLYSGALAQPDEDIAEHLM